MPPPYAADIRPWQAQWIGLQPTVAKSPGLWTCYRADFQLKKVPATAIARIAVDTKYWLWLNGKPVIFEGQVKRGPTPQDTFMDEVELGPYLRPGRNTIAILVWFWNRPGKSHLSSGRSGLIFEMPTGTETVASDSTWKIRRHPAYGEPDGEQPNELLSEHNIRFDARQDIGDWMLSDYDDSAWEAPHITGRPPCLPWGRLWPRPIPQWKDHGLKDYTNVREERNGSGRKLIATLPYNAQITPWLKVKAPAGKAIDIRSDCYSRAGAPTLRAEYITREGIQIYESLGWINGHEIHYTIPDDVEILGLKFRETAYNSKFSGDFVCNDPFYNKLWEKCRRTLVVNMRDNHSDCPDRERAQWWGDLVNALGQVYYSLGPESTWLGRKAVYDLILWKRTDDILYSPVPSSHVKHELPSQMLLSVGRYGIWTYLLYTGDRQTAIDAYPHVKSYLSIWNTGDDGLVIHRKGDWAWYDWGSNVDTTLIDNTLYCLALDGALHMAEWLGYTEDAAQYKARRKRLITEINARLWDGNAYRSMSQREQNANPDDRGNALAVLAGIPGPERHAALRRILTEQMHATPYMEKFVLEALFVLGDADAALTRMKRRYEFLTNHPLTTLGGWKMGRGSYNHAWGGGPLTLMGQYVAGITPLEPGYTRYQIRPQLGPLDNVRAVVDTVQGPVKVHCIRNTRILTLHVDSPPNATAEIALPISRTLLELVTINGKQVYPQDKETILAAGVKLADTGLHELRFILPAGNWKLEYHSKP